MKKKIILISVISVLVIGLLVFIFTNKKTDDYSDEIKELVNQKIELGELRYVTCSVEGKDVHNVELSINDKRIIAYSPKEDLVHIDEYRVDEDDIKEVKDYITKYNLPVWTNLPIDNPDLSIDSIKNLNLVYNNYKINGKALDTFSIDINDGTRKEHYNIVNKLIDKLYSLLKKENLAISYDEKYQEE